MITTIYLSSDHAGFDLKNDIKNYLLKKGINVIDLGTNNNVDKVSYADYGKKLANAIVNAENNNLNNNVLGIGVCGTGIGISFAVNRFKHVRGARITSIEDAKLAKLHNNANILLFGGRQETINEVIPMIETFLNTEFEGGRHIQRINELDQ